jgi:hypothetical protein
MTQVQPAARAAPTFLVIIALGKFLNKDQNLSFSSRNITILLKQKKLNSNWLRGGSLYVWVRADCYKWGGRCHN